VTDARDSGKILQETSGNKTVALKLQRDAEAASQRAARIKNTTEEIRDKLDSAEAIQGEVEQKLAKVRGDIEASRWNFNYAEPLNIFATWLLPFSETSSRRVRLTSRRWRPESRRLPNVFAPCETTPTT